MRQERSIHLWCEKVELQPLEVKQAWQLSKTKHSCLWLTQLQSSTCNANFYRLWAKDKRCIPVAKPLFRPKRMTLWTRVVIPYHLTKMKPPHFLWKSREEFEISHWSATNIVVREKKFQISALSNDFGFYVIVHRSYINLFSKLAAQTHWSVNIFWSISYFPI